MLYSIFFEIFVQSYRCLSCRDVDKLQQQTEQLEIFPGALPPENEPEEYTPDDDFSEGSEDWSEDYLDYEGGTWFSTFHLFQFN